METASTTTGRGRTVKYTPERVEQIKNLVERGTSREQIAEIIGVTVGSLQVTCSRLGISLRRQVINNGVLRPRPQMMPARPPPLVAPSAPAASDARQAPRLALRVEYRGRERTTDLPLPPDMIAHLAYEAACRGVRIGDLVAELIAGTLRSAPKETAHTPSNGDRGPDRLPKLRCVN
jgi:Helix-turn-helix domain of resolvase